MAYTVLRFDMRAPAFSETSANDLYRAALEMAALSDERGFDSLTLSKHHGVEDGFLSSPTPPEIAWRSLELFTGEVMPKLV